MKETFSPYQKFVVAVLAFIQFTVILDFMILSPLGAILMEKLAVTPKEFGAVVSAYAFSAATSGFLAAGFADRFDRRKLLLFFYSGFVFGTFLCGIATSYKFLLVARVVTGLFGGVISSISFAIIADLFPLSMRGRVMGIVQTAFAGSQILGIPIGLYLATKLDWHAPFMMIVGVSLLAGIVIALKLQPVTDHLKVQRKHSPFAHLVKTAMTARYIAGFAATILLATGGFMLMPFGSAYLVNNIQIPIEKLPPIYMVTGLSSIIVGPLLGRVADTFGKYRLFVAGSVLAMIVILYFTRLGPTPIWVIYVVNVFMFAAISARMVSSMALTSGLPEMADRGAYMSISSSLQQLAGGAAAALAGVIVVQPTPTSPLENYPTLGIVVVVSMIITVVVMFNVHRIVSQKAA